MTTGLVMGTVMTQTILWIVTMMVETAVALTSTHNSALNVCVLVVGCQVSKRGLTNYIFGQKLTYSKENMNIHSVKSKIRHHYRK